jgi:AcrR family transcriptional regulator
MPARSPSNRDARRQRTRDALLGAFFVLVLRRRYHEIRIEQILAKAGVGRSTFYEHFANKDALLAASIAHPFGVLADSVLQPDANALSWLLNHFWENRALARGLFEGAVRRKVARVLVDMIDDRLKSARRAHLRLPSRLAAIALAEAQLAPIIAWLSGESACTAETLARVLLDGTQAQLRAFANQA